ncbi:hypothetical protein V6N13_054335 [Hibiscus sabdariffa]|uniref:non-specific serine/threonine protein kinase n=1 Tax=Hibiscus sabdariffa TaxID=183260 RepID=A0ABR2DY48_9ROSI
MGKGGNRVVSRDEEKRKKGILELGNYVLGKTLGEGSFSKVKLGSNLHSGLPFAFKILDKSILTQLNIANKIKREIAILKMLKHPNVVRLHEVLASKTKIYMVLEYATGGDLYAKIASKGKLSEDEGRKLFHQLIHGVSFCHDQGVFHRDLKLENVLIDGKGNIKITDFGLSALAQHLREDGLLHTTCGSPNYVAPEVLARRGYHGATSDIWSCGVILFTILAGYRPFEDRNISILYRKLLKGDMKVPKGLSPGARRLIRRMLDPNPRTRITMAGIKDDEWFKQDYTPVVQLDEEDDIYIDDEAFSMSKVGSDKSRSPKSPSCISAFQLIGMSSSLDLSGFFEKEDVSQRTIRFTSNHSAKYLFSRIEDIVTEMGFRVQTKNGRLKATQEHGGRKCLGRLLSIAAEVFEISSSLHLVELTKSHGDSAIYRQLCTKLSNDLGIPRTQGSVSRTES